MWVVLQEIFQSPDFTCDGVGGDYVLPGVRTRYLLPSPLDHACPVSLTRSVAPAVRAVPAPPPGASRGCYVPLACCAFFTRATVDQDMGDYLNDPSGRLDFRDMPASIIQVRRCLLRS